ncbi:hypothetical protein [Amycolatopsis sp. PS_44_ISF1]|uniref:hypothetical protein n=1 Tax=Amycolatopsis sp. PS_44_ISF1 TaxID=2974917 RepID=UPI0028DDBFCA|nr:hypothetical protein [Amycolatopsis sp. PS_44_ISF1]MDT8910480.1 hypothetical protein [Amycolatopsis sp. PS_44_ISF1]
MAGRLADRIGTRLLLATSPPTVFDADTGVQGGVGGLPGGDRQVSVQRVGHTPVILTAPECRGDTCEPAEVYAYPGALVPLGQAFSVAPAADGEGVWQIRPDSPGNCRLQHVSLAGRVLGTGTVASCRTVVRQETSHGLLITVDNGNAETVDVLIDPATGRSVQQAPRILAATGDRLVLGGLTELTVVDLRDGGRAKLAPPVVQSAPYVLPNREGTLAAVDFGTAAWRNTDTQTRDLWLLDLRDLTWLEAPSMPYTTGHLRTSGLDWSPGGDLVLDDGVVATWHPGEPAWRLGRAKIPADRQSPGVSTS